jgi:alkylation response protein AidB-like acyl-CoA dehydrogenase
MIKAIGLALSAFKPSEYRTRVRREADHFTRVTVDLIIQPSVIIILSGESTLMCCCGGVANGNSLVVLLEAPRAGPSEQFRYLAKRLIRNEIGPCALVEAIARGPDAARIDRS